MAEHDIKSTKDGMHVDIPIDHVDKHENYTNITKINDIAVVHLSRDVEFTGRSKFNSSSVILKINPVL